MKQILDNELLCEGNTSFNKDKISLNSAVTSYIVSLIQAVQWQQITPNYY